MEHAELIKEMPQIERMSNQERLKLAHNRRKLQIKAWNQLEKAWATTGTGKGKGKHPNSLVPDLPAKSSSKIRFRNAIMLLEAAGRNDVEEVRALLEDGVNADVANEDGLTALHQSCIDDNEELLTLLLASGANVNAEDSERWTPLHAAATCGHLHLVKILIERGANLLAVNAEGNMPYDICDEEATLDYIESEMAKRGVTQDLIEEIRALPETRMLQDMQILQAEGADLQIRDPDGATFLHVAAANGYLRVVEFLLDHNVATDIQDKDCWQPIHAAACWGHIEVLELLVQNGADLNARTKNNETPYAICEDPEMKDRIIQLRSELETKLREGGVRKIRRSQSSNSRTQSIRRTSQRDKGLTSKRDAADEAQMLLTMTHSDGTSPSPTGDLDVETKLKAVEPVDLDLSSGDDEETVVVAMTDLVDHKEWNHNNNLIKDPIPKYNNPIAIPRCDPIPIVADLPLPDIHPIVEVQPTKGVSLSGAAGGKDGNTFDIHVQVTINTSSPTFTPHPLPHPTFTPPGTLADLKKQRSLQYSGHSRSNSLQTNGIQIQELPPKYEPPPSPTMSLKRFSGNPGDIVGDYNTTSSKKCCSII